MPRRRVGVLALQGAFGLHCKALAACGAEPVEVRRPAHLDGLDALVLPGGESTTMSMLLDRSELFDPVGALVADGLPVLGTCAGMILLATAVLDGRPDQHSFGAIDLTVRRNAYGRQVDSFDTPVRVQGLDAPFPASFIRAPWSSERASASRSSPPSTAARCCAVRPTCSPQRSTPSSPATCGSTNCSSSRCATMPARRAPSVRRHRMSGHSKWATIKHKKAATDKKRAKVFAKLIRQVEVAAREGGGDPDANPTLRTFYQKARDNSIPLDTIERAIKRGTGELDGVTYEQITYEGYGPNGVAILMEVLTDNRNRVAAEVRNVLTKNGGSSAEPGAVSWQFERKGVLLVPRTVAEDDVMLVALEAGAEDITDEGTMCRSRPLPPTCLTSARPSTTPASQSRAPR